MARNFGTQAGVRLIEGASLIWGPFNTVFTVLFQIFKSFHTGGEVTFLGSDLAFLGVRFNFFFLWEGRGDLTGSELTTERSERNSPGTGRRYWTVLDGMSDIGDKCRSVEIRLRKKSP